MIPTYVLIFTLVQTELTTWKYVVSQIGHAI